MKKLLSILLLFVSLGAMAQTYDALPTGSKPYGNQLYLTPTGLVVSGTGSAKFRVIGAKKYVDSLLALKADLSVLTNYVTKTGTETLTNKTLTAPVINTPEITNGTANALVILNSSINNTPIGTSIPAIGNFTTANATGSSTLELLSHKGQANGYPSLDGSGKVPVSQMPDALVGAVVYQGNYNASNNTPALPVATGNKGKYYVIAVAGTQQGFSFENGDWIISNGSIWQKVDNSTKVASVNGMMGAVTIDDVPKWGGYPNDFSNPKNTAPDYIVGANTGDPAKFYTSNAIQGFVHVNDGSTITNNISGNAATATVWGNKTANFDARVNSLGAIPVFDDAAFGQARYALAPEVKSWLGINDGSVLNNLVSNSTLWNSQAFNSGLNTSVGPLLAYDNTNNQWRPTNQSQINAGSATLWGGIASFQDGDLSTAPNAIMGYDIPTGKWRPHNNTGLKSFLATSLQDVTNVGNTTNLELISSNGSIKTALSYSDHAIIGALSNHALGIYAGNSERITVLADGKTGILNQSPTEALDVNGNIKSTSFKLAYAGDGSSYQGIKPSSTTFGIDYYSNVTQGDVPIHSFKGYGPSGEIDLLTITNGGKIGINNTLPTEALDVNGNIKSSNLVGPGESLISTTSTGVLKRSAVDLTTKANLTGGNTFSGLQTFSGSVSFSNTSITSFNSPPQINKGLDFYNSNLALTSLRTDNSLPGSNPTINLTLPTQGGKIALQSDITNQASSGTYTPTLTSLSNIEAASLDIAHYLRIGNQVTVYGQVSAAFINGTTSNASISMSLPIASNLTSLEDVCGHGSGSLTSYPTSVAVLGDPSNDWAVVVVGGFPAQSNTIRFSFTYTIK